ncbi:MAG: type II toxin-antitoxin system PemK/MazF family toxin [Cyanobium sp.]
MVKVPFPFSERQAVKGRPAVVLSKPEFQDQSGHVVLTMVTSAQRSTWPLDWPIQDLEVAGLQRPCLIRLKIFTLDQRLVLKPLGRLGLADQLGVKLRLNALLAEADPKIS